MILACEGPVGPAGSSGADGSTGAAGADGADGADGESSLVGYASFNAGDGPGGACVWVPDGGFLPCVYNLGGSSTDSVTVEKTAVGDYRVFFHGNYGSFEEGASLRYLFTVLGTIYQGDGTYVAAASHTSDGFASAAGLGGGLVRVETRVQIWNTTDLTPADKDFSVVLLRDF